VVTNPIRTTRGYLTFGVLVWVFAMLVGVLGVGLLLHESPGGFAFTAGLLTLAVVIWLWVFRRFTR
jgi:hypothetical protein